MHGRDDKGAQRAPERLKRRAEFLRVGGGKRWHGTAMSIQAEARASDDGDDAAPRFGFTLTKKVGNSVVRNRARRRLREALRLAADLPARTGHDYVIVGKAESLRMPFPALRAELARGLEAVHLRGKRRDLRPSTDARPAERPASAGIGSKGTRPHP